MLSMDKVRMYMVFDSLELVILMPETLEAMLIEQLQLVLCVSQPVM